MSPCLRQYVGGGILEPPAHMIKKWSEYDAITLIQTPPSVGLCATCLLLLPLPVTGIFSGVLLEFQHKTCQARVLPEGGSTGIAHQW